MRDPERLLAKTQSVPIRRALQAGASLSPGAGAEMSIWAALSARLPPTPGGGPSGAGDPAGGGATNGDPGTALAGEVGHSPAGAGSAVGSSLTAGVSGPLGPAVLSLGAGSTLKSALLGLGLGLAAIGGGKVAVQWTGSPQPVPSSRIQINASVRAASTLPSSRSRKQAALVPATDSEMARPPPSTSGVSVRAVPVPDRVRQESRTVAQARAALHAGNPERAIAIIALARQQYPLGVLDQERDALEVEALSRLGRSEDAERLAQQFRLRHPESPLVPRPEPSQHR